MNGNPFSAVNVFFNQALMSACSLKGMAGFKEPILSNNLKQINTINQQA